MADKLLHLYRYDMTKKTIEHFDIEIYKETPKQFIISNKSRGFLYAYNSRINKEDLPMIRFEKIFKEVFVLMEEKDLSKFKGCVLNTVQENIGKYEYQIKKLEEDIKESHEIYDSIRDIVEENIIDVTDKEEDSDIDLS